MDIINEIAHLVKPDGKGCLIWIGYTSDGRPRKKIAGRTYYVARLVYVAVYGEIPEDKEVMHECDNPRCLDPLHLRLGSHKENMEDASSKGRMGRPRAFSKEDVRRILLDHRTQRTTAKEYGVDQATISNVRRNPKKYLEDR